MPEGERDLTGTRPDRNAKVLQVEYRARSPEEAVRMVRAIATSDNAFLEDVSQKNNSEVVLLMTRAHDGLGKELDHSSPLPLCGRVGWGVGRGENLL